MAYRKYACATDGCETLVSLKGANCQVHYKLYRQSLSKWAIGRKFRNLTVMGERFTDPVDGIEKLPCRCDCGAEHNYNASTVTQRAKIACDKCVVGKIKSNYAQIPLPERIAKLTPRQKQVFEAELKARAVAWRKTFGDHLGNVPPPQIESVMREILTAVEHKSDVWCEAEMEEYKPRKFKAEALRAFGQYQSPTPGGI